jgi:hypothetical protein
MPVPSRSIHVVVALLALGGAGACAPHGPAVVAPAMDAERLAASLEGHTSLEEPIRVVFAWSLNESGVRVKGRGVARIEPPYRARLDLFLDHGETVVSAALVDGDLRIPPGMPEGILPPPDLMWGVLGVFRPDTDTKLLGADRLEDGSVRLRYAYPDGRVLAFQVANERVRSMELLQDGHVVQRVALDLDGTSRYPDEATYRNLAAFRELKLTRETLERVGPYPPDIFDPLKAGAVR